MGIRRWGHHSVRLNASESFINFVLRVLFERWCCRWVIFVNEGVGSLCSLRFPSPVVHALVGPLTEPVQSDCQNSIDAKQYHFNWAKKSTRKNCLTFHLGQIERTFRFRWDLPNWHISTKSVRKITPNRNQPSHKSASLHAQANVKRSAHKLMTVPFIQIETRINKQMIVFILPFAHFASRSTSSCLSFRNVSISVLFSALPFAHNNTHYDTVLFIEQWHLQQWSGTRDWSPTWQRAFTQPHNNTTIAVLVDNDEENEDDEHIEQRRHE